MEGETVFLDALLGPAIAAIAPFIGPAAPPPPPPPPVVISIPAPTTIAVPKTTPAPPSGHYVCVAGGCSPDELDDPGPNNASPNADPDLPAHGDTPGRTLGSLDRAYGDDLAAQLCDAKPWLCESGER